MSKVKDPLMEEFYIYESNNQLTKEERNALLSWVKDGNSVHDNPFMAEDGHGNFVDFINTFRTEKEQTEILNSMSEIEQENYIAMLRAEDTIDNLRETINKLSFEVSIMEKVIAKYRLQAEVEAYRQESIEYSKRLEDYIKSHPLEELPFS